MQLVARAEWSLRIDYIGVLYFIIGKYICVQNSLYLSQQTCTNRMLFTLVINPESLDPRAGGKLSLKRP